MCHADGSSVLESSNSAAGDCQRVWQIVTDRSSRSDNPRVFAAGSRECRCKV